MDTKMESLITVITLMCMAIFIQGSPVRVDRIEMCDPNKDYPIKWMNKLKEENGNQILEEGSLTTAVDMGDNIMNKLSIFSWKNNEWQFLLAKEDHLCTIIKDFVGEFATDMEKAAGLSNSCPYPKGRYSIKNFILDFSKFKYKNFPDGKVKLISEHNDEKTDAYDHQTFKKNSNIFFLSQNCTAV